MLRSRSPRRRQESGREESSRRQGGAREGTSHRSRRRHHRQGDEAQIATLLLHQRDQAKEAEKSERKKRKELEQRNKELERKLVEEVKLRKKTATQLDNVTADLGDAEAEQAKMEGALQKGKKHIETVKKEKEQLAAKLRAETREKKELASLMQKQNVAFTPVKAELLTFKIKVGSERARDTVTVVEDSEEASSSSEYSSSSDDEAPTGSGGGTAERTLTRPTAVKSGMPVPPASLAIPPTRSTTSS